MRYNFDEIIDRQGTACYKYDLRKQVFRNGDVIPLWLADMDFRTPPFILDALRRRLDHEILGYTYISKGFYDSAVHWNERRHHWKINPGWISFAPGVVPALNLLVLAFTEPGDGVIVQPPVYFPFFSAVTHHGRRLVHNPLKYNGVSYTMDMEDLENKIDGRTRMMMLCSPHNPAGIVWPADVLRRLAGICLKHGILLVSDEIHADLVYKGFRHVPVASLSDEIARNTVTCMAPSKTFNLAGLSTSYVVIRDPQRSEHFKSILEKYQAGTGNIFGYIAMEAAYTSGDEWLSQLMEYLDGNLSLLRDFILRHLPRIRVINPQATYLVWLDCSGLGMTDDELRSFMIRKAGLGMSDGSRFGKEGEGFQRINIACPRAVLYEALLRLRNAVEKYFGQ